VKIILGSRLASTIFVYIVINSYGTKWVRCISCRITTKFHGRRTSGLPLFSENIDFQLESGSSWNYPRRHIGWKLKHFPPRGKNQPLREKLLYIDGKVPVILNNCRRSHSRCPFLGPRKQKRLRSFRLWLISFPPMRYGGWMQEKWWPTFLKAVR